MRAVPVFKLRMQLLLHLFVGKTDRLLFQLGSIGVPLVGHSIILINKILKERVAL